MYGERSCGELRGFSNYLLYGSGIIARTLALAHSLSFYMLYSNYSLQIHLPPACDQYSVIKAAEDSAY